MPDDETQMHDRNSSGNAAAAKATELLHGNVNDIDRMKVAAQLVNTFNFAILKQAKRPIWNEKDMRAFSIALVAVGMIGAMDTPISQDEEEHQGDQQGDEETFDTLERDVARLALDNVENRQPQGHRTPPPPNCSWTGCSACPGA